MGASQGELVPASPVIRSYKKGANTRDQAQIKRMMKSGLTAMEISKKLRVEVKAIKSLMHFYETGEYSKRVQANMDNEKDAVSGREADRKIPLGAAPQPSAVEGLGSAEAPKPKVRG